MVCCGVNLPDKSSGCYCETKQNWFIAMVLVSALCLHLYQLYPKQSGLCRPRHFDKPSKLQKLCQAAC